MSEVLNKDPDTYDRERREFIRTLRSFHQSRGTPIPRAPRINGKEVDLYLLFSLVSSRGGYEKVNHTNEWSDFLPNFLGWKDCANGAVALKHLYLRYLDHYEKIHRGVEVEDAEDIGDDSGLGLGGSRRHRRGGFHSVHTVPLSYNHSQHILTESVRQQCELAPVSVTPSTYEKVLLSLSSSLPNEQEFALNILTLLCSEGSKDPLRLEKCPALIDYLLFHAGVFRDESLHLLSKEYVERHELPDMASYWAEAIPNRAIRETLLYAPPVVHQVPVGKKPRTSMPAPSPDAMEIGEKTEEGDGSNEHQERLSDCDSVEMDGVKEEEEVDADCLSARRVWGETVAHEPELAASLFSPARGLGATDRRGVKASRVALIIHNASFEEHNVPTLAANPACLRFLLMCIHAAAGGGTGVQLSHIGWSTLANLAPEVRLLDPDADRVSAQVLRTVTTSLLESADRAHIMGALEALARLASREGNEENLCAFLPESVYYRICELMTVEDILLLLVTLETLLALTSIGGKVCNSIAERAPGSVDALVSLLTIEAQSYGSKACILMRVIETTTTSTVPGGVTSSGMGEEETSVSVDDASRRGLVKNTPPASRSTSPALPMMIQMQNSSAVGTGTPIRTYGVPDGRVVVAKTVGMRPQMMRPDGTVSNGPLTPQGAVGPRQSGAIATATPGPVQIQASNVQFRSPQPHQVRPAAQITGVVRPGNIVLVNSAQPVGIQSQQRLTVGKTYDAATGKVETTHVVSNSTTETEHESYAVQWITANYETKAGASIEQSELYKHYMVGMSSNKRERLPPQTFAYCLRMVFGSQVGPFQKKLPGGAINHYHYFGIAKRQAPLAMTSTATTAVQQPTSTTMPTTVSSTTPGSVPTTVMANGAVGNYVRAPTGGPQPHVVRQQVVSLRHAAPAPPSVTTAAVAPVIVPATQAVTTQVAAQNGSIPRLQPGSPILKAQLSTPPRNTQSGGTTTRQSRANERRERNHELGFGRADDPSDGGYAHRVGLAAASNAAADGEKFYDGGRRRPTPAAAAATTTTTAVVTLTESVSPPLQMPPLTAKNSTTEDADDQHRQQQQQQPQPQQQQTNSSSLIKSLLATKVSQNLEKLRKRKVEDEEGKMRGTEAPCEAIKNQMSTGEGFNLSFAGVGDHCADGNNAVPRTALVSQPATTSSTPTLVVQPGQQSQQVYVQRTNGANYVVVSSSVASASGIAAVQQSPVMVQAVSSGASILVASNAEAPQPSLVTTSTVQKHHLAVNDVSKQGKGLLAEMLEREVHNELPANGTIDREIRISEKGLELVPRPGSDEVLVNGAGDDCSSLKRKLNEPLLDEPAAKRAASSTSLDVDNNGRIQCLDGINDDGMLTDDDLRIACLDGVNDESPSTSSFCTDQGVGTSADSAYTSVVVLNQGQAFIPHTQSGGQPRMATLTPSQAAQMAQRRRIELPHVCLNPETCGEPGCTEKFLDSLEENRAATMSTASVQVAAGVQAAPQVQGAGTQGGLKILLVPQPGGGTQKLALVAGSQQLIQQPHQIAVQHSPGAGGQQTATVVVSAPHGVMHHQQLIQTSAALTQVQTGTVTYAAQSQQVVSVSGHPSGMATMTRVQAPTAPMQQRGMVRPSDPSQTMPSAQAQVRFVQPSQPTRVITPSAPSATIQPSASIVRLPSLAVVRPAAGPQSGSVAPAPPPAPGMQTAAGPVVASKSLPKDEFLCEWAGCTTAFKHANEVYPHACAFHCGDPSSTEEMTCLWGKCDAMKRKRFSIMTHLLDKHCNEAALKVSLNRRKRTAMGLPCPPEPEIVTPSTHAGYAPNAAYQAIRRHALEGVQQACKQEDKEGPVTKSIRLTAALILKNMVTYSDHAKKMLKCHESELANVAASNVESSRTVAQILFDLQSYKSSVAAS
ncbi:unnamed protein product [Notodromas monacha]|uniref:AT-rich interactive domain-containing protein 2 n=1 Tax=Notodromas monacha TaxID=399045 RepID=A0A7R9BP26_9CRUS|nr:unnamed protein product [Notodromas monacha]CAG0917702.1 unnamed protein product [Notodromas monacha]